MHPLLRIASVALVAAAFGLALFFALPGAADTASWWAESVEVPTTPATPAPEPAAAPDPESPPEIVLPVLVLSDDAAPGEAPPSPSEDPSAEAAPEATEPPEEDAAAAAPPPQPPRLDPNTATFEELLALPGIGPRKAAGILELRRTRPIRFPEDLLKVRGIGRKTLERLRPLLGGPLTVTRGVR